MDSEQTAVDQIPVASSSAEPAAKGPESAAWVNSKVTPERRQQAVGHSDKHCHPEDVENSE